jgi:hypothetical protein
MSDYITTLIPEDPSFVPSKMAQDVAIATLRSLAPKADDVASGVDDGVSFRDCGANFESVACPKCRSEIEQETWQTWMDQDYSDPSGFRLSSFVAPCCGAEVKLNDLVYDWPQGFSRYYLSASNVGRPLSSATITKLEGELGCKLRVIRQHF